MQRQNTSSFRPTTCVPLQPDHVEGMRAPGSPNSIMETLGSGMAGAFRLGLSKSVFADLAERSFK